MSSIGPSVLATCRSWGLILRWGVIAGSDRFWSGSVFANRFFMQTFHPLASVTVAGCHLGGTCALLKFQRAITPTQSRLLRFTPAARKRHTPPAGRGVLRAPRRSSVFPDAHGLIRGPRASLTARAARARRRLARASTTCASSARCSAPPHAAGAGVVPGNTEALFEALVEKFVPIFVQLVVLDVVSPPREDAVWQQTARALRG